ncbi:hypothetical protein CSKR_104601 [Clonorchis sinensis]|uniref:Uncharacterized protein n=1 Tax=Clonorchis sinensis TaxID=79923 RepID=A0A419PLX6_CLOSI|nr:hypothetical protein CSKR_104601 [Clonorchis sinensis]
MENPGTGKVRGIFFEVVPVANSPNGSVRNNSLNEQNSERGNAEEPEEGVNEEPLVQDDGDRMPAGELDTNRRWNIFTSVFGAKDSDQGYKYLRGEHMHENSNGDEVERICLLFKEKNALTRSRLAHQAQSVLQTGSKMNTPRHVLHIKLSHYTSSPKW